MSVATFHDTVETHNQTHCKDTDENFYTKHDGVNCCKWDFPSPLSLVSPFFEPFLLLSRLFMFTIDIFR